VKQVAILSAAYFYVMSNISLIITIMPFMAADMDIDRLQQTLLLAIFPIVSLPANLLLGPLADQIGRRKFLIAGSAVSAVIFALSGFVSGAWTAILLRGLTAIFTSMIACSIFSSIRDYFSSEDAIKVTGYVSASASVAQLVGIPLVVLIAETVGWRMSFAALSMYGSILVVMITRLPAPKHAASQIGPTTFRSHLLGVFEVARGASTRFTLFGYAMYSSGTFVFLALYPTWLLTQTETPGTGHDVSLILLSGGIGSLAGAVLVGMFGARYGSARLTCSVLGVLTAGSIAFVPFAGHSIQQQIAAYSMACLFRAILVPIVINGTMAAMPPTQRGAANGILAAIFQIGTALGGVVSAQLYAADGTFVFNVAVALGCFLASAASFGQR